MNDSEYELDSRDDAQMEDMEVYKELRELNGEQIISEPLSRQDSNIKAKLIK